MEIFYPFLLHTNNMMRNQWSIYCVILNPCSRLKSIKSLTSVYMQYFYTINKYTYIYLYPILVKTIYEHRNVINLINI